MGDLGSKTKRVQCDLDTSPGDLSWKLTQLARTGTELKRFVSSQLFDRGPHRDDTSARITFIAARRGVAAIVHFSKQILTRRGTFLAHSHSSSLHGRPESSCVDHRGFMLNCCTPTAVCVHCDVGTHPRNINAALQRSSYPNDVGVVWYSPVLSYPLLHLGDVSCDEVKQCHIGGGLWLGPHRLSRTFTINNE